MEERICGSSEVDVDLLREHTEYAECAETDPHIQSFWRVLKEDFTAAERTDFIKFAAATGRLPSRAAWGSTGLRMMIKPPKDKAHDSDAYLPYAQTCTFHVHLPRYSSDAIMSAKLRLAMSQCQTLHGEDAPEEEPPEDDYYQYGREEE